MSPSRVAVIIPFRGDPATLSWVLQGFAHQELPPNCLLSVRIAGDGCPLPPPPATPAPRITFSQLTLPWCGVAEAKHRLLDQPADILIFVNADTRPDPHFVAAHIRRLTTLPPGSMVLGSAPYEHPPAPTVFDILKEESPMIFFYSRMLPLQSYDFRHAWTLNLSMWHADYVRTGGFNPRLRPYGHEDIELAYRLMGPHHKNVFYDPAAAVLHRHPMTLADYLNREEALGIMAPILHDVSPALFSHLFGPADLDSLAADYRTWLRMDAPQHRWTYQQMAAWCTLPATALGQAECRQRQIMTLYQLHIPLKRLAFRLGFLHGLALRPDSQWQNRRPTAQWRAALTPT